MILGSKIKVGVSRGLRRAKDHGDYFLESSFMVFSVWAIIKENG